jgi:hypothetical protein
MLDKPIRDDILGRIVRPATEFDVETCDAICEAVHGHDRDGEVRDSMKQGTAKAVVHGERITGYTMGMSFYNHSVGLTNDDLKALIASAPSYGGPGILIPTGNTQLFRWCLDEGLKLVQQLNPRTIGMYNEPVGA